VAILSIQSQVASGYVGNAAAVFALQRMGHDVWPVPTVLFSNHPGLGGWRGQVLAAPDVAEILAGLRERGCFERCAAVLTGYLGSAETGSEVVDAWRQVRRANPGAVICCDPVMGDRQEGVYVTEELTEFYRHEALGLADVVFPNAFELEALTGCPVEDAAAALDASRKLMTGGAKMVLVTSVPDMTAGAARLTNLLVTADGAWTVTTPRRDMVAKGAGDFLAALWLGHYLRQREPAAALAAAASSTYRLIELTGGEDELSVVTTQDDWLNPEGLFAPVQISD